MVYLLEDIIKNKFNRAFYQEDLWKYVENNKFIFKYYRCEILNLYIMLVL